MATPKSAVEMIKPNAGALRGVRPADLCGSDVDALLTVLPRITVPALTKAECLNLDPVDLIALGGKVIGFVLEVGRPDWPRSLTVNDLMADVAAIFHWPRLKCTTCRWPSCSTGGIKP